MNAMIFKTKAGWQVVEGMLLKSKDARRRPHGAKVVEVTSYLVVLQCPVTGRLSKARPETLSDRYELEVGQEHKTA